MRPIGRIHEMCDVFYGEMSDHGVYDVLKVLKNIGKVSGRDVFNIEDYDLEELLWDSLDGLGDGYCHDDKDKELYLLWKLIEKAWRQSPDLRLGQFFMAYFDLDEELTIAQVRERIMEHYDIEEPLCVIKTYYALPCSTEIFKVKGVDAYEMDFGETESEGDGNYGCAYHRFVPYREPKKGVLEKYGITLEEYEEICKRLKSELYVGGCGWCS